MLQSYLVVNLFDWNFSHTIVFWLQWGQQTDTDHTLVSDVRHFRVLSRLALEGQQLDSISDT
jgi:hypothetical protein